MTHRNNQRDERRQAEYWKQRALEAEAQLKRARAAQQFDRQPVPVLDWVDPETERALRARGCW